MAAWAFIFNHHHHQNLVGVSIFLAVWAFIGKDLYQFQIGRSCQFAATQRQLLLRKNYKILCLVSITQKKSCLISTAQNQSFLISTPQKKCFLKIWRNRWNYIQASCPILKETICFFMLLGWKPTVWKVILYNYKFLKTMILIWKDIENKYNLDTRYQFYNDIDTLTWNNIFYTCLYAICSWCI